MDMSKFETEIKAMNPDQVRAELAKAKAEAAKRMEHQKQYNAKPENQAKRKEYSKTYNSRPEVQEKRLEYRKAYMARPEVKERQKAYRTGRTEYIKALEAKALELGIDLSTIQPSA